MKNIASKENAMHVFLTGEVQCGKSTALSRALEQISRPLFGFKTLFTDRYNDNKALYMLPAGFVGVPESKHIVAQFVDGKPQPLTQRFNEIGAALLQEAQQHPEGLILMDECSRFERDALDFQREIFKCLDGDIPVLGVVRQNASGWVDAIRSHPNVKLLTVTVDNRDRIPDEILCLLNL